MGRRMTEAEEITLMLKQSIKENKATLRRYRCYTAAFILLVFLAIYLLVFLAAYILVFLTTSILDLLHGSIVPTCHVHPVGSPEWTTDFQNFSEKNMCSPCIICHEWPGRPYVIGDNHYGDAQFMEWYNSWPMSVTGEDRVNCVC